MFFEPGLCLHRSAAARSVQAVAAQLKSITLVSRDAASLRTWNTLAEWLITGHTFFCKAACQALCRGRHLQFDAALKGKRLIELLRERDVVITAKLDRMVWSAHDALSVIEPFQTRYCVAHLSGDVLGNGITS
jgi:hypothetical protein